MRIPFGGARPEAPRGQTAVKIAGLLANGTFVVVVFWVHPKGATGTSDDGWVHPGRTPAIERLAGLGLVAGWGAQLLSFARPTLNTRGALATARLIAGGTLIGGSVRLAVSAQDALGPAWRTSVIGTGLTPLATGGPYRLIRHPVYTAMIGVLVANLVICYDRLAAAGAVLALAGLELQVRAIEEPALRSAYGELYSRYSAKTGRLIPFIGRIPQRSD